MAAKKGADRVGTLIAEVEKIAKDLRAGIRKRAAVLPKDLKAMAARLRKRAAHAAAQVEKYAHQIRLELESGPRRAAHAKPARRNRR